MKKIVRIFSINLSIFIALLFFIEVGSRVLIPSENITPIFSDQNLRIRERPFVEAHQTRGFALKPGFSNGIYSVNEKGFRGDSIQNKRLILTLGESTTFGWGVKDNETYPFYLEKFFPKKTQITVINGGVPSYTSSQVLVSLEEILNKNTIEPDMVLICILWNDLWYSTISNWHPDILIYQKPPAWISWLTKHSRFCHGWVMGFSKKEKQKNVFNPGALAQYEKNIEQMIRICRDKNIALAFVEPPFDGDHMPEKGLNEFHVGYDRAFFIKTANTYIKRMKDIAQVNGIHVIDHDLGMRNLHQKPLFLDALHPTAQGNYLMALDVYNAIELKKLYR